MTSQTTCKDNKRANIIKDRKDTDINGIDYLEVVEPQKTGDVPLIVVFCFKILDNLDKKTVRIEGGTRIKNIDILWVAIYKSQTTIDGLTLSDYEKNYLNDNLDTDQENKVLLIRPTIDGDFSTYMFRLVDSKTGEIPPPKFDPILSSIEFRFKIDCASDFDCLSKEKCPQKIIQEPLIDYMAKDYQSFRQTILDRISLTMPEWKERNLADFGIMLVELLAYVGDQLSYFQDAVASEAYLGTARKRISIKRHARLLDYVMHDGCNARVWIAITVEANTNGLIIPKGTKLMTGRGNDDPIVVKEDDFGTASIDSIVFETMHDQILYDALNTINFYTWADSKCYLPKGATSATLINNGLDSFIFSWNKIPGTDSNALKKFLQNKYNLDWITTNLNFTNNQQQNHDNITEYNIAISDGVHFLTITFNHSDIVAIIKLNKKQIGEFIIKDENSTINLYSHLLQVNDVLIFEEVRSPTLGDKADSDPLHRQAVRLISISPDYDDLTKTSILNISWHSEDALLFPLCLEQVVDSETNQIKPVSVAHGNIVLADHGYTIFNGELANYDNYQDDGGYKRFTEFLGNVPSSNTTINTVTYTDTNITTDNLVNDSIQTFYVPPFRPKLSYLPLTFSIPFDPSKDLSCSASSSFSYTAKDAIPYIIILGEGKVWTIPVISNGQKCIVQNNIHDLLSSGSFDYNFVVEVDNDGTPIIRFGDDEFGRRPRSSSIDDPNPFFAIYRIGNGVKGNVGRETISRVVSSPTFNAKAIQSLRNPMEANGGTDPQNIEEVRQFAPQAFRTQERAVTMDDYAVILQKYPGIQKALATLRWTGSWYTVFVAIDRLGGFGIDDIFKQKIIQYLNKYRLAVYDLEIVEPHYVPLDILINVCISLNFFWSDVEKALMDTFSNHLLVDGTNGFFHPDNFTFGDPVYLSKIIDRAMNIPGVYSIKVEHFRRLGQLNNENIKNDISGIFVTRSEIIRLDNDPNFPENGKIVFSQEISI